MTFNKKIAFLLPTIVFVSSIISCNKSKGVKLSPFPATLFDVEVESGDTVEFRCNDDARLTIDWGDGTVNNEKSHTYSERDYCIVQVSGNLTNISFSDENGVVYQKANDSIRLIVLSSTITSLPSRGFVIANLDRVYIPNSIKEIGEYAFDNENVDEGITFFAGARTRPNGWSLKWARVESFVDVVFWNVKLGIAQDGIYSCVTQDGVSSAFLMTYYGSEVNITVPDVVSMGGKSYPVQLLELEYNEKIESVRFPLYANAIGPYNFSGCTNLKQVDFSRCKNMEYIGWCGFRDCKSLTSFCLPKTVRATGGSFLEGNYDLAEITVENGNEYFISPSGSNVIIDKQDGKIIAGCHTSIIPPEAKIIGDGAFTSCKSLTSIAIPSTVKMLDRHAFGWCDALTEVDLTSITSVEDIPECLYEPFYKYNDFLTTFKYSSSLQVSDFTAKGWPEEKANLFHWEAK